MFLKFLKRTQTISLDIDWFYRKGAMVFLWFLDNPMSRFGNQAKTIFFATIPQSLTWFSKNPQMALNMAATNIMLLRFSGSTTRKKLRKQMREEIALYPGEVIRYSHVGTTVIWVMGFLLAHLIIYIVSGRMAV
ncbi:MAG: hypothetical protein ACE5GU_08605 [Candidatus Scalinduaceae bacterium]